LQGFPKGVKWWQKGLKPGRKIMKLLALFLVSVFLDLFTTKRRAREEQSEYLAEKDELDAASGLTSEEKELVRKQLQYGHAAAKEAAKGRGYELHPKLKGKFSLN
jgi:hypothetical protein